MRLLGESGVWELFVPGVGDGTLYKFLDPRRRRQGRARRPTRWPRPPRPRRAGPRRSSQSRYEWDDDDVDASAPTSDPHTGPMSVYEVHLGSWRRDHGYRDLAEHLVNYVADLGFTHVELMPVMEHPYPPSWGYHVTSYYAPSARFGRPDDFRYLVDRLHQAGIGVILDWVPGHFATDPWALARFDGLPLYEHPDPRKGWHPEWGSYIFDFGRIAGAQLPRRQRDLLARGVPRRRPAGRRRRLDALPRLLPQGRRVDPQQSTAAARTSRRWACSRRPTPRHTSGCPAS